MRPIKTAPSLSKKLFVALVTLTTAVAFAMTGVAAWLFHAEALADEHAQLAGEAKTLATLLNNTQDDEATLASLSFGDIRATLVAQDGTVTFDSAENAAQLPNHALRPEIVAAQKTGTGSADRASTSVGHMSVYEAVLLTDGQVLRLSVDRATTLALLTHDVRMLVSFVALIVIVSWVVSHLLADRLVRPILELELEREQRAPYQELSPLVERLNEQRAQLVAQVDVMRDVADSRREFTANVSHELKTPIASISGASELMYAGLVAPADIPQFAERIHEDAQRLSALVSDILTLSKLDDAERAGTTELFGSTEQLQLASIAQSVAERLQSKAAELGVQLALKTEPATIWGNAKLAEALMVNLCDNALRYNRPGGMVELRVFTTPPTADKNERVVLEVADSGIGIPLEAQAKVFERFYRVDQGRSREMGGTGLGLAIAKHAAINLGGELTLESQVGKGTTVRVEFEPTVRSQSELA